MCNDERNHTIQGVAHAAATDWLLTIYNLLEVAKETATRRQVTEILNDLAKRISKRKRTQLNPLLNIASPPLIAVPAIEGLSLWFNV